MCSEWSAVQSRSDIEPAPALRHLRVFAAIRVGREKAQVAQSRGSEIFLRYLRLLLSAGLETGAQSRGQVRRVQRGPPVGLASKGPATPEQPSVIVDSGMVRGERPRLHRAPLIRVNPCSSVVEPSRSCLEAILNDASVAAEPHCAFLRQSGLTAKTPMTRDRAVWKTFRHRTGSPDQGYRTRGVASAARTRPR